MCLQCEYIHQLLWGKLLANGKYVKLHLCWGVKENDWKLWATATVVRHPWHGSGWGSLYITTHRKKRLEKSTKTKPSLQSGHHLSNQLCLANPQRTLWHSLKQGKIYLCSWEFCSPCPTWAETNHFVPLLHLAVPTPALASHQSGSKQDLCTERMKKGVSLLAVVLIQHNAGCALQL